MTSDRKNGEKDSALNVMRGIHSSHDGLKRTKRRKFVKKTDTFSIDTIYEKLIEGSRMDLAKAITLIESMKSTDQQTAQQLLKKTLPHTDRKSTRLNSSHVAISYAVYCLKK